MIVQIAFFFFVPFAPSSLPDRWDAVSSREWRESSSPAAADGREKDELAEGKTSSCARKSLPKALVGLPFVLTCAKERSHVVSTPFVAGAEPELTRLARTFANWIFSPFAAPFSALIGVDSIVGLSSVSLSTLVGENAPLALDADIGGVDSLISRGGADELEAVRLRPKRERNDFLGALIEAAERGGGGSAREEAVETERLWVKDERFGVEVPDAPAEPTDAGPPVAAEGIAVLGVIVAPLACRPVSSSAPSCTNPSPSADPLKSFFLLKLPCLALAPLAIPSSSLICVGLSLLASPELALAVQLCFLSNAGIFPPAPPGTLESLSTELSLFRSVASRARTTRIASCSESRRAMACIVSGWTSPSFEAATNAEEGVRARGAKAGRAGDEGAAPEGEAEAGEGTTGFLSETTEGPSVAERAGREEERASVVERGSANAVAGDGGFVGGGVGGSDICVRRRVADDADDERAWRERGWGLGGRKQETSSSRVVSK